MSVFSIAFNNFKNNIKIYSMFFIAMIFSVTVLSNFFILMNGESLKVLEKANAEYTKMIIQLISVVLIIFIFFFIWYTSNIFLKNRKKEIGLFTFMGVESKTIGKIYFFEMMLGGLFSCAVGIFIGGFFSKFFQMIVFHAAGFDVDVMFNITYKDIINTFIVFMSIFMFMSIKGFINIVRSNVIDLLNESKKTEKMPKVNMLTYIIALVSAGFILYGYYLVIDSKANAFKTLILVCIGTYGVFYALIPVAFKYLISRKAILYKGENIIAINSLAYRIKKNYTTYAVIGILTACTITVLGTAVSMKNLYTMSEGNDNLYSMSFYSDGVINDEKIEEALSSIGDKQYELKTPVLMAKSTTGNVQEYQNETYNILSYDQLIEILKTNGNDDDLKKINKDMVQGNKVIYIQRPGTLASLLNNDDVTVNDHVYEIREGNLRLKTLGSLLNNVTIVVNNDEYNKIKPSGEMVNFYGIKVSDDEKLLDKDTAMELQENLTPYLNESITMQVGVYKVQSVAWLKIIYSIGAFLFLVFVLAEASIIYTKIYSDAGEDKQKYKILSDIGISKKDMGKAICKETALFYILPLSVGILHSFFAIKVLGDFLSENLLKTFMISVIVCAVIFAIGYVISVKSFKKIVNI